MSWSTVVGAIILLRDNREPCFWRWWFCCFVLLPLYHHADWYKPSVGGGPPLRRVGAIEATIICCCGKATARYDRKTTAVYYLSLFHPVCLLCH